MAKNDTCTQTLRPPHSSRTVGMRGTVIGSLINIQLIKKKKKTKLPRHTSLMFRNLLARGTDYIEHLRNNTSAIH